MASIAKLMVLRRALERVIAHSYLLALEGKCILENALYHVVGPVMQQLDRLTGQTTLRHGGRRNKVVLVPGFFQQSHVMMPLQHYLHERGWSCEIVQHKPYNDDLRKQAATLEARLEELADQDHKADAAARYDLIGHSQGGLIVRYVAQARPELVERCITLGTPHHGTRAASLAVRAERALLRKTMLSGISAIQMMPGSEFLKELNSAPLPGGVQFYSIYGERDVLVWPPESARLEGAENIPTDRHHMSLIGDRSGVFKIIFHILSGRKVRAYKYGGVIRYKITNNSE